MNKTALAMGGVFLAAGGLAYWYFSQQQNNGPVVPCSGRNQSDCVYPCYWYDGSCHSDQQTNGHECDGDCFYEGSYECDSKNNLCKCVNGKYQLSQYNSTRCLSGKLFYECFPSQNKIATCIPQPGVGNDLCNTPGFSEGCSCFPPNLICDDLHFCDERANRCILIGATNISADNSNWYDCSDTSGCTFPGQTCIYMLDGEHVASTIGGTFGWEWGSWGVGINVSVFGYLTGVGWTYLGDAGTEMWGATGDFRIDLNFSEQGISALAFACCNDTPFVNTKPKSFYGSLV